MAHKAVWSPQNPAIRYGGREISYADLEERVAHLAGHLRETMSIGAGDRVAYVGANNPAVLDLLFACARIGAIFVPLNSRMAIPQLEVMLDNADPACLFAGSGFTVNARGAWGGRATRIWSSCSSRMATRDVPSSRSSAAHPAFRVTRTETRTSRC